MAKIDKLNVVRVRDVKLPTRGTPVAAGIDFYVPNDLTEEDMKKTFDVTKCPLKLGTDSSGKVLTIEIGPGEEALIPSGIKVKCPKNYCLKFENKSGIAAKKSLIVGSNVVDEDYEGVVHINLHNVSKNKHAIIAAGDKIVQALLYPMTYPTVNEVGSVEELYKNSTSARGQGGFGSTGNA